MFLNICAFPGPIVCSLGHFCSHFFWCYFPCRNTRIGCPLLIPLSFIGSGMAFGSSLNDPQSCFSVFQDLLLDPSFHPSPHFFLLFYPNLNFLSQDPKVKNKQTNKKPCWFEFSLSTLVSKGLLTISAFCLSTCSQLVRCFLVSCSYLSFFSPFFSSLCSSQNSEIVPTLNAKSRQNLIVKWTVCFNFWNFFMLEYRVGLFA